jgi:subtilisin family serine protease
MIDSGFYRHPYYAEPSHHGGTPPSITTHGVLAPTSDPDTDEVGHGTGIAANVLAIAPECDFHHVKDDGDPLAALVLARTLEPSIITGSWGWREDLVASLFQNNPQGGDAEYLRAVESEIHAAINDGVSVLFASGNGPEPGAWPSSAEGVVSVGGALVDEDLSLTASTYATSFRSLVNPGRLCPDVCGIVGPAPAGLLFALPTQPGNEFDGEFSGADGTAPGDGWLVASGTSSATPQLAGMAALLMQMHDGLTPQEVLRRFQEIAVGVHRGRSASGHAATSQRPNLATGYGLVTYRRPQLANGFSGLF